MALLSSQQVAQKLGVTRGRVLQWCREDRVEGAQKIGRDWVIAEPIRVEPRAKGPQLLHTHLTAEDILS